MVISTVTPNSGVRASRSPSADLWDFFSPCSGDVLALPKVQCPNHPDAMLVEDYRAGDMICPECGLVVGEDRPRTALLLFVLLYFNFLPQT